jgi:hypothetical protein
VGNYTKRINITTNDPKQQKVGLKARGKILVPFKTSPRFITFRNIDPNSSPQPVVVKVTRGDGGPLDLEIERFGKQGIEAVLEEVKAGEEYHLIIGVSPPQKPGRLRSWIRLKTGVKEMPEKTIPIYAEIPQSWSA